MQKVASVSYGRKEPLPLPMIQSLHHSQAPANESSLKEYTAGKLQLQDEHLLFKRMSGIMGVHCIQ